MTADPGIDALVDAIRAADGGAAGGVGDDDDLAVATRLRVMRSLVVRARGRHQLIGLATAIAILLGGTVSWALATGQVLWSPSPVRMVPPPVAAPGPPRPAHRAPPRPPTVSVDSLPAQPPAPEPVPVPVPVPVPPSALPPAPPAPVAPPPPIAPRSVAPAAPAVPNGELLYRRAHDLHFHGSDPVIALAAWDAYLAADPAGQLAVEARYNRALVLVRLGRYVEARAALLPFARGEVAPAGYRRSEAEQLVERLARYQ